MFGAEVDALRDCWRDAHARFLTADATLRATDPASPERSAAWDGYQAAVQAVNAAWTAYWTALPPLAPLTLPGAAYDAPCPF